MIVRYKTFDSHTMLTREVERRAFFGGTYKVTEQKRQYKRTHDLYQAVATFCSGLGDKFVTITGRISNESSAAFSGELVVWYKE